jgi:hypothetical protein
MAHATSIQAVSGALIAAAASEAMSSVISALPGMPVTIQRGARWCQEIFAD